MQSHATPAVVERVAPTGEARRLVDDAKRFEREGNAREAVAAYDLAIALLEPHRPTAQLADVLRWKGTVLRELGAPTAAEPIYERSLELSRRLPYAGGIANALNCLAIVAHRRGNAKRARRFYAEAALNAVHAGERRLCALIEQNLGALSMMQGDLRDALARFRLSLRGFRDGGDDEGVCMVLGNLGRLHTLAAEFEDAEHVSREALALAKKLGDPSLESSVELVRAELLLARGQTSDADAVCRRALALADRRGDTARRADAFRLIAMIGRQRGELENARRALDQSRSLARASEDALLAAEVEREAGEIWLRRGEPQAARMAWEGALERFRAIGASRDAGDIERRLAALAA